MVPLNPKGQFTENCIPGKSEIKLRYGELVNDFFHKEGKPLLEAGGGEWGVQLAKGEPTSQFALLYLAEIDYGARTLYLRFEPEKVKPILLLSKGGLEKLKEDWERLRSVSRQVHTILSEYAQDHELAYSSPFRFPVETPEGQKRLPGLGEEEKGE